MIPETTQAERDSTPRAEVFFVTPGGKVYRTARLEAKSLLTISPMALAAALAPVMRKAVPPAPSAEARAKELLRTEGVLETPTIPRGLKYHPSIGAGGDLEGFRAWSIYVDAYGVVQAVVVVDNGNGRIFRRADV